MSQPEGRSHKGQGEHLGIALCLTNNFGKKIKEGEGKRGKGKEGGRSGK